MIGRVLPGAALDDPCDQRALDRARIVIERVVLETGRSAGLFLNEDDQPEARWLIRQTDDAPAQVVNVTFGAEIDLYVFDRSAGEITHEETYGTDEATPGDRIANVIRSIASGSPH